MIVDKDEKKQKWRRREIIDAYITFYNQHPLFELSTTIQYAIIAASQQPRPSPRKNTIKKQQRGEWGMKCPRTGVFINGRSGHANLALHG